MLLHERLRSWLFIVSVLALLSGPFIASLANRMLDARFQAPNSILSLPTSTNSASQDSCVPSLDQPAFAALEKVDFNKDTDLAVSARMAELSAADQAVRQLPVNADPQAINAGDTERRDEVLDFILKGALHSPHDLVIAAYIFQHGDCSEHYLFANHLAKLAMDAGYEEARWIYAATLDRYLMSQGELQKYGTQYAWVNGTYTLYPVDPTTTDAERAEYNVPPLNEAMQSVPEGTGGAPVRRQWLASWWLTLIGAGFAALGALIALADKQENAPLGRAVLVIALLIYPVSVLGHALQLRAFQSGAIETQSRLWTVLNGLLIFLFFVSILVEGYRLLRKPNH
jgi:hypothetical protein